MNISKLILINLMQLSTFLLIKRLRTKFILFLKIIKKANIPGFRKGMYLWYDKKQYEKAVIVDEVNKLIQEN